MMTDTHVSTRRSRVTKLSRRRQLLQHQSASSFSRNPRIKSVIHISIRSPSRSSSNKLEKSSIGGDVNKQSRNATRVVSVTEVQRSLSQSRKNSWNSTNNSSKISDSKNNNETESTINRHRFKTGKVADLQDIITNKSDRINHIQNRKSLGTIEDLTNSIHKNKNKNLIRCSRKRAIISLISLILLGIIIAIVLIILLNKSQGTVNKPTTVAVLRWNTTGITLFGTTSVAGNASNQFFNPFGIAMNSFNDFYIADRRNNRIQKCRAGVSTCTTVAGQANAVSGTNMSYLNGPTYIYIDSNDNLYIADTGNNRTQFWNYGASSGTTIAGIAGPAGTALNQLSTPYGIALDSNSNTIYISDCNNFRVMKYLSGASSGTIVAGGNGFGTNNTKLYCPAGIYLDSSTNSLIIANFLANNIVRWVLGDNKWTIIAGSANGLSGSTSTLLYRPTSFIFDPMGNMYVADMFNHRIQMYLIGQSNATTIAGISGQLGNSSTKLYYPVYMLLDNQLNLYVTDSFNQRIQKFLRY